MERSAWGLSVAVLLNCCSLAAEASGRHSYRSPGIVYNWYSANPGYVPGPIVAYPGYYANWGYPLTYGAVVTPAYYWPAPMPMSVMPNSPLSAPVDALPAQISPWEKAPGPNIDPAEKLVILSSTTARLKSLKLQAEGDQYLRKQMWYYANLNYRQAVSAADDQATAHLRYGFGLAALKRFDEAQKQFKRAVFIDPTLPRSALTMESLFGPDSRVIRASMLSAAADWLQADLGNADRLFVMGLLLHFNGDERAQELFSAALPISGNASFIAAFLPEGKGAAPAISPKPSGGIREKLPPAPVPSDAPPAPGLVDETPAPPKSPALSVKPAVPDAPLLVPPAPTK